MKSFEKMRTDAINNRKKMEEMGFGAQKPQPDPRANKYDHPNSLTNGEATFWWIVVMIVGAIFHDRVWIWVIATAIWFSYISRHWNVGGKS